MSTVETTLHPDVHRGVTMAHLLIAALKRYPDRVAFQLDDRQATYAEVRDEISRFAQVLHSLGLRPGSGTAMLSGNRPEVLYTQGAAQLVGCRGTPLHPLGSLDDHAYVIDDAGIETLIFDPNGFEERAAQLEERCAGLKNLLPLGKSELAEDLATQAARFGPRELRPPDVHPDDVSALAYTGGTTGKPKGVMMTYRTSTYMNLMTMSEWQWPSEIRFLVITPLSHAAAAVFIPTFLRGGSMIVMSGFDPDKILDTIERHRITSTLVVPTILYLLLDHPRIRDVDLSSLETIYYGAAAASPTRLEEALDVFGQTLFQFYGQTEAPMTITALRKEEHDPSIPGRLATCGRPLPWVHVALLDDECNEVERGEPGEICVRGPLVMQGYWKRPEETEEALKGGWLHTGDIAREDEHGFYTIVDRKKDMIISGGFNIFPREVEDVLTQHPAVSQAAVIGVPDDKWGEQVKAVVVLRPEAEASAEDLIGLVKEKKGSTHAPKSVDFVESIPVSALGKPDKKALRARYWEGQERQVH